MALRLKREFGSEKLWVAAYANDVFAYIPSNRICLKEDTKPSFLCCSTTFYALGDNH